MYLVLIQTSGNQPYIFGTNKLKENVGASQLTFDVGIEYVLKTIDAASNGPPLWHDDASTRRTTLRGAQHVEDGAAFEVVYTASGNALVIVRDEASPQRLVREVTARTLREAPGVDVLGIVRALDWDKSEVLQEIGAIYRDFERLRARGGQRLVRSLTMPVLAKCATSGLPAERQLRYPDGSPEDISLESRVKREASKKWRDRHQAMFKSNSGTARLLLPKNLDDLEQRLGEERWIAVAHADGNGLGQILQEFAIYAAAPAGASNRAYVDCLRQFSLSLDVQAELAFLDATASLQPLEDLTTPIVPLVLGGDDLTVILSGSRALQFGCEYLKAFEHRTASLGGIDHQELPRLSASIGIALVKPHFPFHAAYHLAEDLVHSAKQVKWRAKGRSAMDFHVLFDSSFTSLDAIRHQLQPPAVPSGRLTSKPYVASHQENSSPETDWSRLHDVARLEKRVKALRKEVDGDRAFSRGQLHALRTALFEGEGAADAYLNLIAHRYDSDVIADLTEGNGSLFRSRLEATDQRETGLLDAMEIAGELWPVEDAAHV